MTQSLAETLRNACAANGLGVSGSANDLLARLFRGGKKTRRRKTRPRLHVFILLAFLSRSFSAMFSIASI
jgi:hypothetical protein